MSYVMRKASVDEIIDHIMTLRADAALRAGIGMSLRERALAEFCVAGINRRLIEFLQTIAQRNEA